MNTLILKNISRAFAAFALTALFAAPHAAHAQLPGTSGPVAGTPTGTVVFTFTPTASLPGTFAVNSGTVTGTESFVSTAAGGSYEFTTNSAGNGSFAEFTGANGAGKLLLAGTITGLTEENPAVKGGGIVSLTMGGGVTYTGGSELLALGFVTGDTGDLTLGLSDVTPGGSGPETATSYGTSYSVTQGSTLTTPEPSGLVVFGILGAGMLGAVMLRRKQGSSFAA